MTYLLDSNVVLWMLGDRHRLTTPVLEALEDGRNRLLVSSASIWEISIKVGKGKLIVPGSSVRGVLEQLDLLGIEVMPIRRVHILRTESLAHLHRDPFDRMIIAQALEEKLTVLSSDKMFVSYGATVLWN